MTSYRTHERAVAVNQKQQKHLSEICRCGKGKLEGVGRPILTASCYCASGQEAGSRFEQLPSAPPVLNPDGGTDYVLYRKDRVQCVTGQEYLEEHRLKLILRPGGSLPHVAIRECSSTLPRDIG